MSRKRRIASQGVASGRAKQDSRWRLGALASAVLVVALGAGLLLVLYGGNQSPPAEHGGGDEQAGRKAFSPGTAEDWKGPLPIEVAERFTQAQTRSERLKWIRNPQRMGPALEDFFTNGPGAREKVTELKPFGPVQTADFVFQRFHAKMEDGTGRLLCVVASEEEGARVDFACYARHGSESWEDLLSGTAMEAAQVRVFVQTASYYNYAFADDRKWRSFIITTPDLDTPLYVYVARESEVAKQLGALTVKRAMRTTLAIRSVERSFEHHQFEVTKVLGPGWVIGER